MYNRGDCRHQERRADREKRCYCQSYDDVYGKNRQDYEYHKRGYNAQVDAINDHAWDRCPLKSKTAMEATKESVRQKIQLQIEYASRCAEEEISARLKLKEMRADFEKTYNEPP